MPCSTHSCISIEICWEWQNMSNKNNASPLCFTTLYKIVINSNLKGMELAVLVTKGRKKANKGKQWDTREGADKGHFNKEESRKAEERRGKQEIKGRKRDECSSDPSSLSMSSLSSGTLSLVLRHNFLPSPTQQMLLFFFLNSSYCLNNTGLNCEDLLKCGVFNKKIL